MVTTIVHVVIIVAMMMKVTLLIWRTCRHDILPISIQKLKPVQKSGGISFVNQHYEMCMESVRQNTIHETYRLHKANIYSIFSVCDIKEKLGLI